MITSGERRKAQRQPRLKPGRIIFNSKNSVISCQLRDVSLKGARLRFANTRDTPDEFIVDVPGVSSGRWAKRVWATVTDMGIAFL